MSGLDELPPAYRAHLRAATAPDAAAVRKCWEQDGVLEFPYAGSVGGATRLEGAEAIAGYFETLALFGPFVFTDVRVERTCGDRDWLVELHGSSVVLATDEPYEQDYIVRFGLSSRGRLAWMREYWDPTRM